MATQNINSSTAASAITGSDSIFISKNNNALQKIDYDILAKAIIEQYNGSTLAGSAQTLQAAINALNSKLGEISFLKVNTVAGTPSNFTVGKHYRGILITIDSSGDRCGIYFMYSNSSAGVTLIAIRDATAFTINRETQGQLQITSPGASSLVFLTIASNIAAS